MADRLAFELSSISIGLGSRPVLQEVDLAAPEGIVLGLIGRNGAGKSTLMRLLAGREGRFTGEAEVLGEPLPDAASGQVFLTSEYWPFGTDQRFKDLIRHLGRVHRNFDQERALELLAWFDVPANRYAFAVSRGQRTAAFLSLALAARSPLTLLDEPYLGLDVPARRRFTRILTEELRAHPRTLILSTHLVDEAEPLFDRVAMMEAGRVIAADTVPGLLGQFIRVHGPVEEVSRLPRLGRLDRAGGQASVVVRRGDEAGFPSEPVDLKELADLLIGPRREVLPGEDEGGA
ncbi:MAG: ABC transporter ATP-binding protein [Propionibacteriaceae bacterium]|nr:ABC transporter ATP-binding protein [Propionibacteriaceae bacterium]